MSEAVFRAQADVICRLLFAILFQCLAPAVYMVYRDFQTLWSLRVGFLVGCFLYDTCCCVIGLLVASVQEHRLLMDNGRRLKGGLLSASKTSTPLEKALKFCLCVRGFSVSTCLQKPPKEA